MAEPADTPAPSEVIESLHGAIGNRYLTYALSTIMHRALPDARDGLKPVHRRILYAMRQLRLSSSGGFRKSAKISGDVMGNFHPHGDAAIYDALARLAQDFNLRYPLVDGQGNFGNIDGDNPAASRYTEARLTLVAEALLEGLDEDAVDFRDNYDGSLREPVLLPAAFPNLLANGAAGIAVGMATNIPPHNIAELCEACLHLIKTPKARDDTLLNHIQGPDFPTGGVIVEPHESIAETYRTGRGAFRLRCAWKIEEAGRGQWRIVVTEIPFQVQKSRLVERLADLVTSRKIPFLSDIRDESAEDVRIVLEPRSKNIDPNVLMELLFRNSELETRFQMNLNVLIDGVTPRVCSLKDVLLAFLDHRREVLRRRAEHRKSKIEQRLEVLEGLLVAFLNLDRVIDIIRYDDDPKAALMRENWVKPYTRATSEADYVSPPEDEGDLTEAQAEAILNMRLRSLRRLEEQALRGEQDALMKEHSEIVDILSQPKLASQKIAEEIQDIKKRFGINYEGGARRTRFAEAAVFEEPPIAAMVEREPITVVCSRMGWVRAMAGHIELDRDLKFRDGDESQFVFHAETTDRLLVSSSNGRFYTLNASNLPGGRGLGEPLRLMIDLPNEAEIIGFLIHRPDQKLLVASNTGYGFILAGDDALAQTRNGRRILNVREGESAKVCVPVEGDHVAVVSEEGRLLVFPISELPEMARGKGIKLQQFGKPKAFRGNCGVGGGLSDATTFHWAKGLSWPMGNGKTRTQADMSPWLGRRAGTGKKPPFGFPKSLRFSK